MKTISILIQCVSPSNYTKVLSLNRIERREASKISLSRPPDLDDMIPYIGGGGENQVEAAAASGGGGGGTPALLLMLQHTFI